MKMTEEHKKKLSESHKGKKSSLETIEKLRKYHKEHPIKYWTGKKFSEEHLLNLKLSQIGRKHSQEVKDKIRDGNKHKIVSEETRLKQSKYWKGRMTKDKNPNWRGGSSFEPYSVEWTVTLKRSIRERDKYTCKICNKQQEETTFPVHHIDYNKNNCNPNNLITLCNKCHTKTNFHRNYWTNYFNNLIK